MLQGICIAIVLFGPSSVQTQGTLLNVDGTPIHGGAAYSEFYENQKMRERSTPIDASGHFDLGTLNFKAVLNGNREIIYALTSDHKVLAALQGDDGISFKVVPSETCSFHVTDTAGVPLDGVSVSFQYANVATSTGNVGVSFPRHFRAQWSSTTDETGTASVKVISGTGGRVELSKPGYSPQMVNLPIKHLENVALLRGAVARGRVLSAAGDPVPNVVIGASGPNFRLSQATTDRDGGFSLQDLEPGAHELSVIGGVQAGWVVKSSRNITLNEGQEIDGLDFHLERGIRVSGRIVTVESGKPFSGATVMAFHAGWSNSIRIVTQKDGRFQFYAPAGRLRITVTGTPAQPSDMQGCDSDDNIDEKHSPFVTIGVPAAMEIPPPTQLDGTVVDADGLGVPGATVELVSFGGNFGLKKLTTDQKGHFHYEGAVPTDLQCFAAKADAATAAPVSVTAAPLVLKLTGHALAAFVGHCVTDDGAVAANFPVHLTLVTGNDGEDIQKSTTNANGDFAFTDLLPGRYAVGAEADGYLGGGSQIQTLGPAQSFGCTISLRSAKFSLSGQIIDSNGKPLAGAVIGTNDNWQAKAVTDESGKFTLTHVAKTTNKISVEVNGRNYGFTVPQGGIVKLPVLQDPPPGIVPKTKPFSKFIGATPEEIVASRWLNSSPIKLASLRGKIVVLDFWAIWCVPCREELPQVEKLSKQYSPADVVVIGIHLPPIPGYPDVKIDDFVKNHGLDYPIAVDKNDRGYGVTTYEYPVNGVPTVIVVGRDGKIAYADNDLDGAVNLVAKMMAQSGN